MKRLVKRVAIGAIIILLPIQIIRPSRTNPATDPKFAMESELQLPRDISATLYRACGDCHSNHTHWPWYSEVAPVSWFVADHVNSGRRHINFSNWIRLGKEPRDSEDRLKAMCREVKSGDMPLSSYLLIHWNSKLSEGDKTQICAWADQELRRLSAGPAGPAGN